MATDWQEIARQIGLAIGQPFVMRGQRAVGGGDINQAFVLDDGTQPYFIKLNSAARLGMFEAELAGLQEIGRAGVIRVPRPLCCGTAGGHSFLVLEYIAFGGPDHNSVIELGRQLAALHRVTAPRFGWYRDNTIGATVQRNDYCTDWIVFWTEQRLRVQLDLLKRHGRSGRLMALGERLLESLHALFAGYTPAPSLLHGDLWGGNYAFDERGQPVIFDPAVYYGDRETDLAMTELFGGFPADFYAAYRDSFPLDEGYVRRRPLYNLYHILNHANLFGGGYAGQAERMMEVLLRG
ncbi:MAG: hypothetical protein A2V90_04140 [Gammaproteobacteria bacterium RBG_16_57_12]|nr:MAG: hypothetical protein A2V90_04140 [Gammaproteobacteria bacterium RBG_16_57_12]